MSILAQRMASRHLVLQVRDQIRRNHTDSLVVYRNPRRLSAAGMTLIGAGQAGFWVSATAMAQQVPDPLFSPAWSVAGFGLSAAFIGMIGAFLRRNVAEISLVNGPSLRITTHSFCGMLRTPVIVSADDILPGPKKDDPKERYWTFGARQASGKKFYYIVDTKKGVFDKDALSALARGGDHLLVFAHKRDGGLMRHRWQEWERAREPKDAPPTNPHSAKPV